MPPFPQSHTPDSRVVDARVEGAATADFSWHPDLLREVERDLATWIGPMATIALKRAARQTTDITALYELLSRHIENSRERTEFLAQGRRRAAAGGTGRLYPAQPLKPVTEGGQRRDRPTPSPSSANLASIESTLARYVGPIARVLVKRELGKSETLDQLYAALATHIPDERDREKFLRARGGS